ncbi:MAG: AraC family transcriptional regulator [Planctomycetota bacterium]
MSSFVYAGVLQKPRAGSAPHSHDHWEICRYFHGTGVTTIGKQEFHFEPGSIIVFPPRIPHAEHADAGGYQVYYVGLRHYAGSKVGTQICRDDSDGNFMRICHSLMQESQLRQAGWESIAHDLLHVLVTWLQRWTTGHDELVSRTEQALLARMADPDLRIESIASELDVSVKRLRERFSAALGVSPRQYLTRLRLNQARTLLQTGHSVATTAELVGLRDAFYFSRLFRSEVGVAPSAVRKK